MRVCASGSLYLHGWVPKGYDLAFRVMGVTVLGGKKHHQNHHYSANTTIPLPPPQIIAKIPR